MKKASKPEEVYSFDIFDTCISRIYCEPTDLFMELAQIICPAEKSDEEKRKFILEFHTQRVLAERTANSLHGPKKSCHFKEIYQLIRIPEGCLFTREEIAQFELQLEMTNTYPIIKSLKLIELYRRANKRIIFISDMYLDNDFIKKLLQKHGFFKDGDGIYVSSENTLTKRSGELFSYVLEQENIEANQLNHYGDDEITDFKVPKKMGINATHITNTKIKKTEIIYTKKLETSKISALAKKIRTSAIDIDDFHQEIFAHIAPLLVSFTCWALNKCLENKVQRIYFLSRDGEIPYNIAKSIEHLFPSVEIRYLYSSRSAWLLPSIDFSSSEWTDLAAPPNHDNSIKDILERMLLSQEQQRHIQKILGLSDAEFSNRLQKKDADKFLQTLIKNEHCKKILNNHIDDAYNTCINYLSCEGILDNLKWVIADTGWNLNCQAALKRILKKAGKVGDITGYYFGVADNRISEKAAGKHLSYSTGHTIFPKRRTIVEHCFFSSNQNSTIGYKYENGVYQPYFAGPVQGQIEYNYTASLAEYMKIYTALIFEHKIPINFFADSQPYLIEKSKNFIENPNTEISIYFSKFKINGDSRHEKNQLVPLCREINTLELAIFSIFNDYPTRASEGLIWKEASIRISKAHIRLYFSLLKIGKLILNKISSENSHK